MPRTHQITDPRSNQLIPPSPVLTATSKSPLHLFIPPLSPCAVRPHHLLHIASNSLNMLKGLFRAIHLWSKPQKEERNSLYFKWQVGFKCATNTKISFSCHRIDYRRMILGNDDLYKEGIQKPQSQQRENV